MTSSHTLCWAWKLTLRDETVFGFTDHDEALDVDGVTYEAASGLTPAATDARLGFSIDNGAVSGVLSSERITAEDIAAGRYDGAVLVTMRVNWFDPTEFTVTSTGVLGEIRSRESGFEAEWTGQAAALDRSVGRVFSRICDAELGDARCGLDTATLPEGTLCARTFKACKAFGNTVNYRGFPYLLGDDALQAAPREGEIFDGGSRYGPQ